MSPLVSIVIPTFNRRDQVLRALESVAKQSYPHLEAIVVDDASTDGTAASVQHGKSRHINAAAAQIRRHTDASTAHVQQR